MLKGSLVLSSVTCKRLCPVLAGPVHRVSSTKVLVSPLAMHVRTLTTHPQPKHILEDLQTNSGGDVHVSLDGESYALDATWLRENCTCRRCFNYVTQQRAVLVHAPQVSSQVVSSTRSTNCLDVKWSDGHGSRYDLNWLHRQLNTDLRFKNKVKKQLWNAATLKEHRPQASSYNDLISKDTTLHAAAIYYLLRNMLEFGFTFIDGVPHDVEGTRAAVESFAPIQRGMFGDMWSFKADGARADTAYSTEALGVHTDNTYLIAPAGLQIFHCLRREDVVGGDTILVDGFNAIDALSLDDRRSLSEIAVEHVYHEDGYHMKSRKPVMQCDGAYNPTQIRYNVYDRRVSPGVATSFYPAAGRLASELENRSAEFHVRLTPGRILVIDNWRVLHGRTSFTGDRLLTGCYVARDDWMSAVRSRGLLSDGE